VIAIGFKAMGWGGVISGLNWLGIKTNGWLLWNMTLNLRILEVGKFRGLLASC